jgi:cytochrome c peroxidase
MHKLTIAIALVALAATGCKKKNDEKKAPAPEPPAAPVASKASVDKSELAAFAPLPKDMRAGAEHSEVLIDLGRQLYYDGRLSKSQKLSCNSCHVLDAYGVDGEPTSPGHKGQRGARNSPTVYNAAAHVAQFWDGRAADVEEQAKGPVLNPVEMAMKDEAAVAKVLASIPDYQKAFAAAFPDDKDPITYDNMAKAIGAFERGLVTPSRWDDYLAGKHDALTDDEVAGLRLFIDTGCPTCHSGPLLGGHIYQKLGAVEPWPNQNDQGRFEVTKDEADKMMFKVPSLRNIAKTGPYFHDGSVSDLGEAVTMMAKHQLGKELTADQVESILAFLGALTGELPADYIAKPKLPDSGPKTPEPDES